MATRMSRWRAVAAVAVLSTMLLATSARPDTVTDWNELATNQLVADGQGASALVHLAMVHGAMYDAVNAIDQRHAPYLGKPAAKRSYSIDAAAATAAFHVLLDSRPSVVQPAHQAELVAAATSLYAAQLAAIPPGSDKDGGIATGEAAAEAMIAARLADGRFGPFRFGVGTLPGQWRPAPPAGVNDPFGWVRDVKPFLIGSPSRFGGPPPFQLTSRQYARDFDEVKSLGSATSPTRTSDQTDAARFWSATNPVETWSRLYRDIAQRYGRSPVDDARMFAMLYLAAADTTITVWVDKDKYSFWRPVTAIREGDTDGNARTVGDPGWSPLVPTPPYPEMPSALSALGGASAATLRRFFGTDELAFGTTNAIGMPRTYARFSRAEDEVVDARVWAGIHFRHADEVGASIGEHIADWQQRRFLQSVDDDRHAPDDRDGSGPDR
jgi:hypothetical protein